MNRLRHWFSRMTWQEVTCYNLEGNRCRPNLGDAGYMIPPRSPKNARQPANSAGMRTELIARIRQEIQAGCYETPEKLEIALERMLGMLSLDQGPPFPPSTASSS